MTNAVLMDLAVGLASGSVKVVDLSVTLSPETPILELPEEFGWGKSWPFSKEEISRYDDRGPAWYWNNIKCGEHTGTHFDAPIHWVTGKDHENHATDTLPPSTFVGPAVVIDCTAETAADAREVAEHGKVVLPTLLRRPVPAARPAAADPASIGSLARIPEPELRVVLTVRRDGVRDHLRVPRSFPAVPGGTIMPARSDPEILRIELCIRVVAVEHVEDVHELARPVRVRLR